MKEKFASINQSIDKAMEIAKSLSEKNMADYEESERLRIKDRVMESIAAIIRADADNGPPITISEIIKGPISVESGSWLTQFRIWRKWLGGRWELWNFRFINQERWVRVVGRQEGEEMDAPIGITVKSVESY